MFGASVAIGALTSGLSAVAAAPAEEGAFVGEQVVTQGASKSVFWSGGEVAKDAAENCAGRIGGNILEDTSTGRALTEATQGMDYLTEAKPLWAQASQEFATNAEGDVNCFINPAKYDPQSIWATVEEPTLSVNPDVTSVNITYVAPDNWWGWYLCTDWGLY
jgi:hypothetical protein